MPDPLAPTPDSSAGWRISDHARDRAGEFGIDLQTVVEIATRPEQGYPSARRYGEGQRVHQRGDLAVVVAVPTRTVVTVLRRVDHRWQHDTSCRRPAPRRVPTRESAPVRSLPRDPELRRRRLRTDPGLSLVDARRMLAEGYGVDHVARLTGYDPDVLVPAAGDGVAS